MITQLIDVRVGSVYFQSLINNYSCEAQTLTAQNDLTGSFNCDFGADELSLHSPAR